MKLRCMCLRIHAPTDLRLEEMEAGEMDSGDVAEAQRQARQWLAQG